MATLKNLVIACGTTNPPGVEVDFYYTCTCELDSWPALSGTGTDGQVRLNAAFDFSSAPSGEGYWRKTTAVVDKSAFSMGVEGEVGGQALFSGGAFYIKGTESDKAEFALDMVNSSGCLSIAIKARNSTDWTIVGSKAVPAFVESLDFNSGQKVGDTNGAAYAVRANTQLYYYADSLGIDTTPNP